MVAIVVLVALAVALIGVPLGYAIFLGVVAGSALFAPQQLTTVARLFVDNVNDVNLIAIPLLVIAGEIMTAASVMEPLLRIFELVLGRLRGGMALASVGMGLFFAGATGSTAAEAAALASALYKPLRARGYDAAFTGALIAASGALGVLLPPSIALIVFGTIIQYPVQRLWFAGIVPGLLGAAMIAVLAVLLGRRYEARQATTVAAAPRASWAATLPALFIPVLVIGGIRTGLLTVSETAAILVAYVAAYGLLARRVDLHGLWRAFERGGQKAAVIFLVLIGARTFSIFVIQHDLAPALLGWVLSLLVPAWAVVLFINVFLLALGIFVDGLSLLIIATPLVYPLLLRLGMSPLQMAIMLAVNIEVAVVHPPFGLNLFAVSGVTGVPVVQISLRILPFIAVLLCLLGIITYVKLPIFLWNASP